MIFLLKLSQLHKQDVLSVDGGFHQREAHEITVASIVESYLDG